MYPASQKSFTSISMVLYKHFGLVQIGDDFRIQSNTDLYEFLNDIVESCAGSDMTLGGGWFGKSRGLVGSVLAY